MNSSDQNKLRFMGVLNNDLHHKVIIARRKVGMFVFGGKIVNHPDINKEFWYEGTLNVIEEVLIEWIYGYYTLRCIYREIGTKSHGLLFFAENWKQAYQKENVLKTAMKIRFTLNDNP